MNRPNIFDFATSELSQDAFLCWLLSWAKPQNKPLDPYLHSCAVEFVSALLGKECLTQDVIVGRQYKNIDVYVIIDNTYFVIIEDKKGTSEHTDQLKRYATEIEGDEKFGHFRKILVYFKMEPQGDYNEINQANYEVFNRVKMLNILKRYKENTPREIQNHIVIDYLENLSLLDQQLNSYLNIPVDSWDEHRSLQGLYEALQTHFPDSGWGFVPNANGGFWGFWWSFLNIDTDTKVYLQIQDGKISFRLKSHDKDKTSGIVDSFREKLEQAAKIEGIPVIKYGRAGTTRAILQVEQTCWIQDTQFYLDLPATVYLMKRAEKILINALQSFTLTQSD